MAIANTLNITGTGLIKGDGAGVFSGVAVTNHAVLLGAASNSITSLGLGTAGQMLQAGGAGADSAFSTTTYPATNAISTLLYASSANVMAALATANSGVLTTGATGIPSIDTTNFHVLSTGVQVKGNNANTAPPAGFLGENFKSQIIIGTPTNLVNGAATTITQLSLGAGTYIFFLTHGFFGATTKTSYSIGISNTTNSFTGTVDGFSMKGQNYPTGTFTNNYYDDIMGFIDTTDGTKTYYGVVKSNFTVGTETTWGTMTAYRIG